MFELHGMKLPFPPGETPFGLWLPDCSAAKGLLLLLHGKSRHSEKIDASSFEKVWRPKLDLQGLANELSFAVAAPLCGNLWYLDSPLEGGAQIEKALAERVLPEALRLAGLPFERSRCFLAGFSMGGYGALALLCRRPELFSRAYAKAPSDPVFRSPGGELRDLAVELLGPAAAASQALRYEHYALSLLERLKGRDSSVSLLCGAEDSLLPHCRALRAKASELGLRCAYGEVPGAHELSREDFQALFRQLQPL